MSEMNLKRERDEELRMLELSKNSVKSFFKNRLEESLTNQLLEESVREQRKKELTEKSFREHKKEEPFVY